MMRLKWTLFASVMVALAATAAFAADDSTSSRALFEKPTRDYTTAPFWVWNDDMTDQLIRDTLADMASQDIHQVFVHPRPGLMTPYLSDTWFHLWDVALEEAKKYDMNVWIYDENSYPSGFAGGFVPEAMPESRGLGVDLSVTKSPGKVSDMIMAVYAKEGDSYKNITDDVKSGKEFPKGEYMIAKRKLAGTSPWFGGKHYVDLFKPGVTQKFLELTLEPYRTRLASEFGKRIPGSFTDEPHLSPAGGFHWTEDMADLFQKRWGYPLMDNLPSLEANVGDWQRIRHNYNQLLLELFIERWAQPYFEYCTKNGIEFTGHYWEHSWPETGSAPDNMAMCAWMHRPGVDILFNQYDEGPHAQFGNVRALVELSSVANQMGWKRTLCEGYGGSGWDARFEDFKRIGDWLYVFGVNTLNEHLSHTSERGARKGDYPPSFSYHAPWFRYYGELERYFTRLTVGLTRGEQINEILLIEPTSTAWMYQGAGEKLGPLGDTFQKFLTDLAKANVEFDLGCEDMMARFGKVDGAKVVINKRAYSTVIISALTENLNSPTVALLKQFMANGGRVLCAGDVPVRVDGAESGEVIALAKEKGWEQVKAGDVLAKLPQPSDGFRIRRADDKGILYHHRRKLADGDLVFFVNTSADQSVKAEAFSPAKSAQCWGLETGEVNPFTFIKTSEGIVVPVDLAPSGSLMVFLSNAEGKSVQMANPDAAGTPLALKGDIKVKRNGLNVLKLDYVDFKAGGESKENIHFYAACQLAFEKNGMERNPWDHAVQFRDEYISKTFPADSGFEIAYKFTIEGDVPKNIYFAMESPNLYKITCNGSELLYVPAVWWYDRCMGKMDISKFVKPGENVLLAKATPFTIKHEVQPAYVLGDFSLKTADKSFVVIPETPLAMGPWNTQGAPFFGESVAYSTSFNVADTKKSVVVRLPEWLGSLAVVRVNGKNAGFIYHQPWQCDITKAVVAGDNTIEVEVIGTPKNPIGPHLEKPAVGIADPGAFRKGPDTGPPAGSEYHTLGYGLFKPFEVLAGDTK